jgi:hypothetical protein
MILNENENNVFFNNIPITKFFGAGKNLTDEFPVVSCIAHISCFSSNFDII